MSLLRNITSGLRALFRKEQVGQEMDEELNGFLEMAAEEKMKQGMSRKDALRAVRLERGSLEVTKEVVRAAGWESFVETLWQDLRFGFRMLRKNSGFTAVVVLTLALGIGANTAIFSVIDAALLNPIPFPQPNRIVDIYASWPQFPKAPLSYPNFLDLQRENHSFENVAVWRIDWFTLTGSGEPQRLAGEMVSANFLSVLSVRPIVGRSFRSDEDRVGAAPVAMVGEGVWKRHFGSDPNIVGKSITLDGKSYTVVGVVPSSVRLLRFQDSYFDDFFVPVGQWSNPLLHDRRFSLGLRAVGRLNPGIKLAQAQAEMRQLQNSLSTAYPNVNAGLTITIDRLKDDQVGDIQPTLLMLWGAVGLVLLIACANVANLLLARAIGRNQEFATRSALGASRPRIASQLLIEGVLLVALGGMIGVLFAKWCTGTVLSILPRALPATSHIELNLRVLAFAVIVSLVAGLLSSLAPALRLSKATLQEGLQEAPHRIAGSHRGMQGTIVAVEIGLALVLLMGAGLLIRSLEKVWAVDPGFDPRNTLTCSVSFPAETMSSTAKANATLRELKSKIASEPGVQSVAIALGGLPFELDSEAPVWPNEKPKPEKMNQWPLALSYIVGPDYFPTMRIPLIRGRVFTQQDDASGPPVTVIDEDLANSMFPGENPVGKRLDFGASSQPSEIVGVVGHVKQWGLDADAKATVRYQTYSSSLQLSGPLLPLVTAATTVIVRTAQSPASLVGSLRQSVNSLDRNAVVYDVRTMHQVIGATMAERRFSMALLGTLAGIALLLAVLGIYGVVSYLVGRRTHEVGIRMALGAQPRDILRDTLGQGAQMTLAGIALGLAAAFGLTRLMRSMLFGVSATDPLTLVAVVAVLLSVALVACYIPARRATRVDPTVALRYE
jgi:predicted permease